MPEDTDAAGARVVALGSELRRLHEQIRDVLDEAYVGVDPTAALLDVTSDPVARCRALCTLLGSHHRREDGALFPWLLALRADLAPVLARLEEDHRLIDGLLGSLEADLDARAPTAVLLRHLEGLDAVMENHFAYEERELVPALDALSAQGRGEPSLLGAGPDGRPL